MPYYMDFSYDYLVSGIKIVYYTGSATSVNIPAQIEGLPVTSIGDTAFYECSSLKSITIPDSVKYIGVSTFSRCSSLKSIVIPKGVTSIGDSAFYECSSLKSITIPDSVKYIGVSTFLGCSSLKSITIPDSVTSIGDSAFAECNSLENINISNRITSIGVSTFSRCSSLKSITIPDSVTSIGDSAFAECSSLESINIPEGVKYIGWGIFNGCSSLTSITIPKSVTSISEEAFFGCKSLESIVVPEGVTSIGNKAFRDCSSLTSITIPKNVTSISEEAFLGCKSLESIVIPEGVTSISHNAFDWCGSLTTIYLHESLKNVAGVDNTIKSFRDKNSNRIRYYDLPSKIFNRIHIYKNKPNISAELLNCVNQIELSLAKGYTPTLDDSIIKIFDDIETAYQKRQKLNNNFVINLIIFVKAISGKKIENAPKYINKFYNEIAEIEARIKTSIEALSPPKVVKEKRAPKVKSNPDDLTVPVSTKPFKRKFRFCPECGTQNISFMKKCQGCGHDISDVIPITKFEYDVENISYNSNFEYKLNSFEVTIKKYKGSSDSVNIPPRIDTLPVTSIGERSFSGRWLSNCRSLESITIPDNVTSIGNWTFEGCNSLKKITIPNSVTSIGSGTFSHCSAFESIKIPNSVTYIGYSAFSWCNGLKSIKIPDSVTSIGKEAFSWCNGLKSIKISNSVTSIGVSAFAKCSSLESITIPEGVTSIGHSAFWDCKSLKRVKIPDSVTSIGFLAFWGCSSLKRIKIPNNVTYIGSGAFRDCKLLKSITIPDSVTFIGEEAFTECESLTTIHFPNSLRNVKGDDNTLEHFRNKYRDKIRYYKTDTKTDRVMKVPDFWRNNFAESQIEPKSNFKYSRTESGIYIDKYIGHNAIVSIPEAIENLPVKSIGYRAFDNENLYKVIIPASVNTIVYSAFVSQQPMHILFKGDSIQIIPQSFIAPQITFYYTNNAIAGILYGIADNNPKYIVNYNAADFDKV